MLVCLQPGRGKGDAGPPGRGLDGGCQHLPLRRRRANAIHSSSSLSTFLPPPPRVPGVFGRKGLAERVVSRLENRHQSFFKEAGTGSTGRSQDAPPPGLPGAQLRSFTSGLPAGVTV